MKKIFTFILICVMVVAVNAQNNASASTGHKCEKQDCQTMMQLKRSFIEENFMLKDQQRDAFWKAYDKRETAEYQAMSEQRQKKEKVGITGRVGFDSIQYLSDEQILAIYSSRVEAKEKLAQIEKTFFDELVKCLTPSQIDQYYQLERKFKHSASKKASDKKVPANSQRMDKPQPLEASPTKKTAPR